MDADFNFRHIYDVRLDENMEDIRVPIATVVQRGTNVACSICREGDQFSKADGRQRAIKRLTSDGRFYHEEDHTLLPKTKAAWGDRQIVSFDDEGFVTVNSLWDVIHETACSMIERDYEQKDCTSQIMIEEQHAIANA